MRGQSLAWRSEEWEKEWQTVRNGFVILGRFGGAAGLPVWVEEIVEARARALFIDNSGECQISI